MKHPAFTYTI